MYRPGSSAWGLCRTVVARRADRDGRTSRLVARPDLRLTKGEDSGQRGGGEGVREGSGRARLSEGAGFIAVAVAMTETAVLVVIECRRRAASY